MASEAFDRNAAAAAVTNGIVGLHREFYGRGATTARTYITESAVFCLMEDIFTAAERTLIEAGRMETVRQTRLEFQDAMRARFTEVVEAATGRRVVGFLSQVEVGGHGVEFFVTESGAPAVAETDGAPR